MEWILILWIYILLPPFTSHSHPNLPTVLMRRTYWSSAELSRAMSWVEKVSKVDSAMSQIQKWKIPKRKEQRTTEDSVLCQRKDGRKLWEQSHIFSSASWRINKMEVLWTKPRKDTKSWGIRVTCHGRPQTGWRQVPDWNEEGRMF